MNTSMAFGCFVLHLSTARLMRGGERQVMLLHQGLLKRGMRSKVYARADGDLAHSGVQEILPWKWHHEADVWGLIQLFLLCRKLKPHFIHCHDAHGLNVGCLVASLLHIPLLTTRRVLFRPINSVFDTWKYRHCIRIIAISRAVAQKFSSVVASEAIVVVPDGVEIAPANSQDRKDVRTNLGIAEDCVCIGIVGHFSGEKGAALLLALAQRVALHLKPPVILCVGPVDATLSNKLRLTGIVIFAGLVSDPIRYYSAFDYYVSTSRSEGLGSALIDAVIRDIPAVATNAGGTRDVFPDDVVLIDPYDSEGFINAVIVMIDNSTVARENARRIGARARTIFSVGAMVDGTQEVYRQVASDLRSR